MLFVPPIVASKRLPASRFAGLPASIGWPLNQSRATPEFPPFLDTEHDDRTDARIENAAPAGTSVGEGRAKEIVSSTAWLNALPPADTFKSCPVPTTALLT